MKYLYILIVLITSLVTVNAQHFEKSVGIRYGHSNAVFFEKLNKDLTSSRYMLNWRDGGRQFTAMKIFRQYDLDNYSDFSMGDIAGQLSFYYGYGAHAGYVRWNQSITNETGYFYEMKSAPVFGLDGIVGLSYDFDRLPLSITVDAKPYFDYWGRKVFQMAPFDVAIGVVYVF